MTRSRALLLMCSLACTSGMLLLATGAQAIPAHPDASVPAGETASPDNVPGQEGHPPPPETATIAPHDAPASQAEPLPDDPKPGRDHASVTAIPCLHAFSADPRHEEQLTEEACSDEAAPNQPLSLQFGRRLGISSGIFGQTDGIQVDYRLTSGVILNTVAGFPVVGSKDEFNTERQFLGVSADSGSIGRRWGVNAYVFEQQDNRQLDDTAIGGSIRYRRGKRSALVFFDYDTVANGWNTVMASGAWKFPGKTTFSASLDVRNSPIHKRHKNYIKHLMAPTSEWNWTPPSARIKHYTKNRRYEVATFGLGLSHAFSPRLKFSGNFSVLDVNNIDGNDTAATDVPREYFYQLKLTGKDLVLNGDQNKLDIRHSLTESSKISSASLDTRYALSRLWNISPRVRTDYRNDVRKNSVKWVTAPAVKMEYRWHKQYGFQIEAGGQWALRDDTSTDHKRSAYFLSLGYQAKF